MVVFGYQVKTIPYMGTRLRHYQVIWPIGLVKNYRFVRVVTLPSKVDIVRGS